MIKKEMNNFIQVVNETIKNCERLCFIDKEKKLQEEAIFILENLREKNGERKNEVVNLNNEEVAKHLLCTEKQLECLINELKMWVALKNDKPNDAWDFFVNAQDSADIVNKIINIDGYIEKLNCLEKILFPPQNFVSTTSTVRDARCSICHHIYDECGHEAGEIYMGEICHTVVKEIKKHKEISLTEEPACKKNRITAITENGVRRDFMTWKII